MTTGFVKLFSSIVTSSIWCEDDATLRVWVAMLATANIDGVVEGSVPGFANLSRVGIPACEAAILKLSSPDPYSRTKDHEGRRIEEIPGGWRILNYRQYRERAQDKDGSRAPYMRSRRAQARATTEEKPPEDGALSAENASQRNVTRNSEQQRDTKKPPGKVTSSPEERRESTEERNVYGTTTTARARERGGSSGGDERPRGRERPPNPLVNRPEWLKRGKTVIPPLAELVHEDPVEVLAKASSGNGRLAASCVRLEDLSDDWLVKTVMALEERYERARPPDPPPKLPEFVPNDAGFEALERFLTAVARIVKPHFYGTWFRPMGVASLRKGEGGPVFRIIVPNAEFARWISVNYADALDIALRDAGLADARLELVERDTVDVRPAEAE